MSASAPSLTPSLRTFFSPQTKELSEHSDQGSRVLGSAALPERKPKRRRISSSQSVGNGSGRGADSAASGRQTAATTFSDATTLQLTVSGSSVADTTSSAMLDETVSLADASMSKSE